MTNHPGRNHLVAVFLVLVAAASIATARSASAQSNSCLVSLKDQGGDVANDFCSSASNKTCTFNLALCLNLAETGCSPGDFKRKMVKAKEVKGNCHGFTKLKVKGNGTTSACGAFAGITLKTKKNNTKDGTCTIRITAKTADHPKRTEKQTTTFTCHPTPGSCPTTTITTTTTTTTTTTVPPAVCGNGIVEMGEQCDPLGQVGCGAGMICNDTCMCEPQATCACGTPDPTMMSYTTDMPGGTATGMVAPAKCAQCNIPANCGNDCTSDTDCAAGGKCRGALARGGLYFGAGLVGVPLPASVPDMGTSLTKTICSGTKLILTATTPTDTGTVLNCTSSNGCLFGPPLPIPNLAPGGSATSTCVINRIVQNALGHLACDTGVTQLNLPLMSDVYLGGDTDADASNGIQPCPVCNPSTMKCIGGDRDGMSCTPQDSASIGQAFPTSHDCPPTARSLIGHLPIGFALSTGTQTKNSFMTPAQPRAVCAFCYDANQSLAYEKPPHQCSSDAECTDGAFTTCRQGAGETPHDGAFGNSQATSVSETGTAPGSLTDHMKHAGVLVSVFCIPPTYDPIIDPSADLPGPGAVSLPGEAQLLP